MITTTVTRVIVCCDCGTLPLNGHADSAAAWQFAADHVALTGKCAPTMHRDTVTIPVRQSALVAKAA